MKYLNLLVTCVIVAAMPAIAQGPVPALSIDAALMDVTIGRQDRPLLSPDGRFLAYSTVRSPPLRSVTSSFGRETSLLPNGMLASLVDARLNILDLHTGETTEINAGYGSNWNAAFSPDGRRVAFLSDAGGTPQVWIFDRSTRQARRLSTASVFVKVWNGLDRPTWSHDGSSVYALIATDRSTTASADPRSGPENAVAVTVKTSGLESQVRHNGAASSTVDAWGANMPIVRAAIERIDVRSGNRHTLVTTDGHAQPFAYAVSPSERWIAYVTATSGVADAYELFVVATAGGTARSFGRVRQIVYDGPAASQIYSSVFHWAPTDDRLAFVQDGQLKVAEDFISAGGRVRVLAAELGPVSAPSMFTRGRFDQVAFTADGRLAIARLQPPGAMEFAVAPLDGSPAHRVSVSHPMHFKGLIYATPTTLWQPSPDTFLLLGSDAVSGKTMVLKVGLSDGTAATLVQEHADFAFLSSVSPRSIIATFTDSRTPADIYEFDASLKRRRRLTNVNPELHGVGVGRMAVFTTRVPSYDGSMRSLKTSVLLPRHHQIGKPPPAIVHVYPDFEMSARANQFGGGRMAGGELASLWLTRGFAVVLPDLFPLTPASEGGGNVIRELRDYLLPQVIRAAELGYIDIDRVVLSGHSFGGYATVAITTETNLFRAAVAYGSAPLDIFSTPLTNWPGTVARIGAAASPWSAFKQYLTNSPYQQADKIRTPLLLIHGTADYVPSHASELMYQGLEQLGRTAQLALYPGESHYSGVWSRQNAVDVTERALTFVQRYIGGDTDATD